MTPYLTRKMMVFHSILYVLETLFNLWEKEKYWIKIYDKIECRKDIRTSFYCGTSYTYIYMLRNTNRECTLMMEFK